MLKHLLPGVKSVKALLSRAPVPPPGCGGDSNPLTASHVLFEHFWLEAGPEPLPAAGRDVDAGGRQFVATPSVHQHLVNLARAVLIRCGTCVHPNMLILAEHVCLSVCVVMVPGLHPLLPLPLTSYPLPSALRSPLSRTCSSSLLLSPVDDDSNCPERWRGRVTLPPTHLRDRNQCHSYTDTRE